MIDNATDGVMLFSSQNDLKSDAVEYFCDCFSAYIVALRRYLSSLMTCLEMTLMPWPVDGAVLKMRWTNFESLWCVVTTPAGSSCLINIPQGAAANPVARSSWTAAMVRIIL